jgi:hypothetical protein
MLITTRTDSLTTTNMSSSCSMPELPDQWTSTAEKDAEGKDKPRPPRYRGESAARRLG